MTARAAMAKLIYEDPEMLSLGFTPGQVFAANAIDTPNTELPFIVIRSEGITKSFGTIGVDNVAFWVHIGRHRTRDYKLIDDSLVRIKEIFTDAVHVAGSDGWILSAATWMDTSPDLVDDGYKTITKYSSFRMAVRNAVTP